MVSTRWGDVDTGDRGRAGCHGNHGMWWRERAVPPVLPSPPLPPVSVVVFTRVVAPHPTCPPGDVGFELAVTLG